MIHTEFDSHFLGSNGNYESSHNLTNYANLRRLSQNNNNPTVVQEDIQGFSRYGQIPGPANIYSTPTINTANSHCDTIHHQYSAQGPHQNPQQWQTYYQNSNSFGSSFTGEVPRQEPAQVQNTQIPNFKPTQSLSDNQNLMQYRNHYVNYSQFSVSNDNHKTSDCSNRTQVNENYISKTPLIRVRDVHSVNNIVCHGVHSNLHKPQRKDQTNHYANYLPSQRRAENSVMQTPYVNVEVSGYKNLNNKGGEYYEVFPDNQSVPVSVNNLHQQNMVKRLAWVPKLSLPNNRNKNEVLVAGVPGPRKTSINIGKSVCPQYAENALMGNKRIKISPRRLQCVPGDGDNVNSQSFLKTQSNQLNSGFQRPAPNFSLSSACDSSNNAVYSISNVQTSRQNLVQRNQPVAMTRTGCNSSILTPCVISTTLNADNQYVSTIPFAGSDIACFTNSYRKNSYNSAVDGLIENSITRKTRPQGSSALNGTYIPSGAFYGVTSAHKVVPEVVRIPKEPSLTMAKENENTKAKVLPGCSKSRSESLERNDCSDNQQGGNRRLSVDEIIKEAMCNNEPSIMKDSIKTEAEETPDSGRQFSKPSASENNKMDVGDFLALVKSEPLTEPVSAGESHASEDHSDNLSETEDLTSRNENSTQEKSSAEGSNYQNNIDRKKLDQLIEFLEGGVTMEGNDIPKEIVESGKRKMEDDSSSHSRRKLKKSSIVKNKNQTREMISLVSCKPSRKELKCSINTFLVSEENSDEGNLSKEDEESKDKTDAGESLVVKEGREKAENEIRGRKRLSPRRNSTKENFEEKKKKRKPKESGERLPITLESDKGVDISKDTEEGHIISTMRAFQKIQYHYCMSCDLNSSNDSFWINVVSGELRCLNCFKKMVLRTRKTALKSKNVLENSLHEPKLPDNIHERLGEGQGEEKKKEEKNDSSDESEINPTHNEITTAISTNEIKQILENEEIGGTKKKRKKDKDSGNGSDTLAGNQAFPSGNPKKRRKKTELQSLENWSHWKSSSNLTESLNKNETKGKQEKSIMEDGSERESERSGPEKETNFNKKCRENWNTWKSSLSLSEVLSKNETKSEKEKSVKSEETERSGPKKETVLFQKLAKQMESKLKGKKIFKTAEVSFSLTRHEENPDPAVREKCGKAKTNFGKEKKCVGGVAVRGKKAAGGAVRGEKEKNEVPQVPKGQSDLMEKLYEKTKKLSWTLLGES